MKHFDYRFKVLQIATLIQKVNIDLRSFAGNFALEKKNTDLGRVFFNGDAFSFDDDFLENQEDTMVKELVALMKAGDETVADLMKFNRVSQIELDNILARQVGADFWPEMYKWWEEEGPYALYYSLLSYLQETLIALLCHVRQLSERRSDTFATEKQVVISGGIRNLKPIQQDENLDAIFILILELVNSTNILFQISKKAFSDSES